MHQMRVYYYATVKYEYKNLDANLAILQKIYWKNSLEKFSPFCNNSTSLWLARTLSLATPSAKI